ncbi:hypothetical protein CR513_25380, partial [Mucuna pruriens]
MSSLSIKEVQVRDWEAEGYQRLSLGIADGFKMKKDNLGKFDPKSNNGTFLGYSKTSKAYRIYNFRTLTVEESIHMKFNDFKLDKELPELDDSFIDLGL